MSPESPATPLSPLGRLWAAYRHRQGILLISVVVVSTLWLAVTGQLVLYIHPRYVEFTVIMAVIGLAFIVASFVRRPHGHAHDEQDAPVTGLQHAVSAVGAVVTLLMAAALVVVPPATLTTATASQRAINSTGLADSAEAKHLSSASSESFASFTVRDWASLLRQTTDTSFYAGKPAAVVGFVTADPSDPENVFYVSRFIVTCCAVDAQPVGVPAYLPGWQGTFAEDQWVEVSGEFSSNPSRESDQAIALIPADIAETGQPSEPYLF